MPKGELTEIVLNIKMEGHALSFALRINFQDEESKFDKIEADIPLEEVAIEQLAEHLVRGQMESDGESDLDEITDDNLAYTGRLRKDQREKGDNISGVEFFPTVLLLCLSFCRVPDSVKRIAQLHLRLFLREGLSKVAEEVHTVLNIDIDVNEDVEGFRTRRYNPSPAACSANAALKPSDSYSSFHRQYHLEPRLQESCKFNRLSKLRHQFSSSRTAIREHSMVLSFMAWPGAKA